MPSHIFSSFSLRRFLCLSVLWGAAVLGVLNDTPALSMEPMETNEGAMAAHPNLSAKTEDYVSIMLLPKPPSPPINGDLSDPPARDRFGSFGDMGAFSPFRTTQDAFSAALRSMYRGDRMGAVSALEYAAEQGNIRASWSLGRMYAKGDDVPQDHLKAFRYFAACVAKHTETIPFTRQARIIAHSFVNLGLYWENGIKDTHIQPNLHKARELYIYAATYFADATAQYHVGRMSLEGLGGEKSSRQAAKWFLMSAEKGHPLAQAELGRLLVKGEGIARDKPRGLMWITIARDAFTAEKNPDNAEKISKLHGVVVDELSEQERKQTELLLEKPLP
jgi:uncharacterized protein